MNILRKINQVSGSLKYYQGKQNQIPLYVQINLKNRYLCR